MFKNRQAVANAIVAYPTLSYRQIGKAFGICAFTVCQIAKKFGVTRPRGSGSLAHPLQPGSKQAVR